jgi:phosphoglycolate phosphatase-like HAD superfamily hydrolase
VEVPAHWRWRAGPVDPGPTVVFDMDGVLSDATGRQHFLEGPAMHWDDFFAACGDDPLIEASARLAELIDPSLRLVLLTARPMRVRPQTLAWLERHGLRWDLLVMREDDDWGSSHTYKHAVLVELRAKGFAVQLAFEDDPRNVEMFRAAGVPTVYIHSGYYQ